LKHNAVIPSEARFRQLRRVKDRILTDITTRCYGKEVIDLAISKDKKKQLIEKYVDLLSSSQAVFLVSYSGMTVAEITQLRQQLYDSGTTLMIVKNTLFRRALDEAGMSLTADVLDGPVAIGAVVEEATEAAKVFLEFAKGSSVLEIKGGLLSGAQIAPEQIEALTKVPSREVLLAQLVGGLQAPISGLVYVLQSPMTGLVNVLSGTQRGLVNVLQARIDQLNAEAA
jgi:large subunit ribosomal protein L10